MSITGRIKFFDRNLGLFKDGATIGASSNNSTAKLMLDISHYTAWESLASNDTVTETITWDLPSSVNIDRLFIVNHNLKEFTVQYWNGAWVDFTSVIGLDGALVGGITETVFADTTAYYEFAEVTTSRIQITATKTQIANAEKSIVGLIVTKELGTLGGFPQVAPSQNRKETGKNVLSGRRQSQRRGEIFSFDLGFIMHPIAADITLAETLFDRDSAFLVWLCGGRRGAPYFKKEIRGFRLQDVVHMVTGENLTESYNSNRYHNPVELAFNLIEAIP